MHTLALVGARGGFGFSLVNGGDFVVYDMSVTQATESADLKTDGSDLNASAPVFAGLPINVRTKPVSPMGGGRRAVAAGVSVACFAVLVTAFWLRPDGRGIGTHEQLGLSRCGFVEMFGLPCPTCGYTTSFSLFAHGRWVAGFVNQPAGFIAAVVCGLCAWGALYSAISGVAVHRMVGRFVSARVVFGVFLVAIVGWAWKIALLKVWG